MAIQFTLSPIEARSKGAIRRLRQAGFVPVSIQHRGMETQHFQQPMAPLDAFIRKHGEATFLDLLLPSATTKQRAMVHEVQRDPLTQGLLHVTFQQIRHDDTLKTHVSLLFQGEPAEVRTEGAMVQHLRDSLEIECGQGDLPEYILVEIGHLHPGDAVRVSDLPPNSHYKILTPSDAILASVSHTHLGMEEDAAPTVEDVPAAE